MGAVGAVGAEVCKEDKALVCAAVSLPEDRRTRRLIAADEWRHFKPNYDHLRRHLTPENLGLASRLRVALDRIGESEADQLAYTWHCGNEPESQACRHDHCTAAHLSTAIAFYRDRLAERGPGMVLKSVGLPPRGRSSVGASRVAWKLLQWPQRRFEHQLAARGRLV